MVTDVSLENKFFYRLVKVMYIFSLALFFIIIFLGLCLFTPSATIPDNEKSYITCNNNGKQYSLSSIGIELQSYESELSYDKYKKAEEFCPKITIEQYKSGKYPSEDFSLKLIYKPRDWSVYRRWIVLLSFISAIYYFVMNIIRETLIYLAFGRKFTWDWITKIGITLAKLCR